MFGLCGGFAIVFHLNEFEVCRKVYLVPLYNGTIVMKPSPIKPLKAHTIASLRQALLASLALAALAAISAGCATSADMDYNFRASEGTCRTLGREIAERQHDSDYRRSLNQKYYQNCVGK